MHVVLGHLPAFSTFGEIFVLFPRPYLWGPTGAQHYQQKQEVGWLLWKQPGMQEVMELLDRKCLLQSTSDFPISSLLEVIHPMIGLTARYFFVQKLHDCIKFAPSSFTAFLLAACQPVPVSSSARRGHCSLRPLLLATTPQSPTRPRWS